MDITFEFTLDLNIIKQLRLNHPTNELLIRLEKTCNRLNEIQQEIFLERYKDNLEPLVGEIVEITVNQLEQEGISSPLEFAKLFKERLPFAVK